MKKKFITFIGFAISSAIIVYFFLGLDFSDFCKETGRLKPLFLLPLVFLMFVANWFRALRWRILLPAENRPTVKNLFEVIMVGFTATFILPLRAGEFVRAVYLSRVSNNSFSCALASIVTERLFDIISLLALLGFCLGFLPSVPSFITIGAKTLGAVTVIACAVIIITYVNPRLILVWIYCCCKFINIGKTSKFTKMILSIAKEFVKALQAISNVGELLLVIFYSACVWISVCAFYWLCIPAFGESGGFIVGAVVAVMIAFAVAAPSAPGFIGTYQAGCVIALSGLFNMTESFSLAYAVISHILQAVFIIVCGFYFLAQRGIRFGELYRNKN